jgi:hypothetical protein
MTHAIQAPVVHDVALGDAGEIAEFLAVHPVRQRRGNGGASHYAPLDRTGFPAYLAANDAGDRGRYPRHGLVGREVVRLPGGSPLWSIWRAPMP